MNSWIIFHNSIIPLINLMNSWIIIIHSNHWSSSHSSSHHQKSHPARTSCTCLAAFSHSAMAVEASDKGSTCATWAEGWGLKDDAIQDGIYYINYVVLKKNTWYCIYLRMVSYSMIWYLRVAPSNVWIMIWMNIDEPMYRLMIHGFRDTFYWINMDNYTYIDVDMDVGYG